MRYHSAKFVPLHIQGGESLIYLFFLHSILALKSNLESWCLWAVQINCKLCNKMCWIKYEPWSVKESNSCYPLLQVIIMLHFHSGCKTAQQFGCSKCPFPCTLIISVFSACIFVMSLATSDLYISFVCFSFVVILCLLFTENHRLLQR